MPRKSYRRIALDELLVKYHGLQSAIFTKYAIESESESASDDDQPDLEMRDISGYDSDDGDDGYDAGSDIDSDDSDDDLHPPRGNQQ